MIDNDFNGDDVRGTGAGENTAGGASAGGIDLAAGLTALRAGLEEHAKHYEDLKTGIPDLAWGLFADGKLVAGENTDGIYRIASMTKSFTAATLLGIKYGRIPTVPDAPTLDLDAPAADYIPALAADAPEGSVLLEATVRDLLTMSGGIPTDDPWADRQESLSRGHFDEVITADTARIFSPGTDYAYSNLGYALLGRIVEELTGRPFTDVVMAEVAGPAGLESSGFSVDELAERGLREKLVPGYRRRRDGTFEELSTSRPGAFSAIGGLFSSVEDLGRWMQLFVAAQGPAGERRVGCWDRIRRDMQQPHRLAYAQASAPDNGVDSYGFGLHHLFDTEVGTLVYHSGGYPGYGSHMRWHPATGTALVILGNRTYAPATAIAKDVFKKFLQAAGVSAQRPAARATITGTVHLPGDAASVPERIEAWLADFDPARTDGLFENNMDVDEPRVERKNAIRKVIEATGAEAAAASAASEPDGQSAGEAGAGAAVQPEWVHNTVAWKVAGERGTRAMRAELSPRGLVMTLDVTAEDVVEAEETPKSGRLRTGSLDILRQVTRGGQGAQEGTGSGAGPATGEQPSADEDGDHNS